MAWLSIKARRIWIVAYLAKEVENGEDFRCQYLRGKMRVLIDNVPLEFQELPQAGGFEITYELGSATELLWLRGIIPEVVKQ